VKEFSGVQFSAVQNPSWSISSGAQYVILDSKKWMKEMPTYAGLTQENGFGSA